MAQHYLDEYWREEESEIEDGTENEAESFYYSVSSYGADYSADVLVSRLRKEKIFVPPFQRKYVWTIQKASRFIESLLLGLPVPGIFLSQESTQNRMLIVDGQQRLMSLLKFYEGVFDEKTFKLKGIGEEYNGKTYKDLKELDRNRLDDSIIHATVIKQDRPSDDDSSIYMVFERLNTGGMPLQPQEIRACIYYGEFNELLSTLFQTPSWRRLFTKENPRMKEQELILRFFALKYEWASYKKGFKAFINHFMVTNRNLQKYSSETLSRLFVKTIDFAEAALGRNAFRYGKRLNAAVFDSVMIALSLRLENGETISADDFKVRYDALLQDDDYKSYVEKSTSSEKSVAGRIYRAIEFIGSPRPHES